MKTIKKILPDALAAIGAVCIVVALWLVSPVWGLIGMGAALIGGAVIYSLFGGGGK